MNERPKNKFKKKNQPKQEEEGTTVQNQSFKKKSNFDLEDFDHIDFDSAIKVKEYLFNHTFNEYVRMILVKLLPLKQTNMVIDRNSTTLKGPPKSCQQLKEKINYELQNFTMKMIRFYKDEDIDEIEFHLRPDFEIKVYRIKFVQLAAKEAAHNYDFEAEAENLINKMKSEKQILVRMFKKNAEKCIQEINSIVNKSTSQNENQRLDRSVSMTSFATVKPQDTSNITNSNNNQSSSSENISQNSQEGPSYYQIPGTIKQQPNESSIDLKSKKKAPIKKEESPKNLLSGYMSEPTEEDSVSVVDKPSKNKKNKKWELKNRVQLPKQKIDLIEIKRYQFVEDEFNEEDFKKWLRQRHQLNSEEIVIQQIPDPYNDDCFKYVIKLVVNSDMNPNQQQDKKQSLEYYFSFKKVIFLKLKNQVYKSQLVKQYTKTDNFLRIEFVKGYKSPKWKENTMWNHILKKDYTNEKRSANTEFFEAFFLQGIKSLVEETEQEIRKKLQSEPVEDVTEQIMFKIDEIADHFRDNEKVKSLLKKHVETVISNSFKYICKIKNLSFVLTALKITLLVKFDMQGQFAKSTKEQILKKLTSQFKIQLFEPGYIIDKFTYQKLQKAVAIVDKQQKSFKFVCNTLELGDSINKINAVINSISISEKQIKIQDMLVGKQLHEYISNLIKDKQFSQIKFNLNIQKRVYVFKFYGRGYILDSIEEKINKQKDQIIVNKFNYYQIVKLKEKEVLHNQEFIDKIHQKYHIYLQPTESLLACRITVTSEDETAARKIINIKKTKTLDYAPPNSVIIFRNATEMEDFSSCWTKTFKNYTKKHNQADPFKQKNRNYTLMIKSGMSTESILKQTLELKDKFETIVLVMQPNDRNAFIKEIVKVLSEEKQHQNREIEILVLERDQHSNFRTILGIDQHSKGKDKKIEDKVDIKYYVEDQTQHFYYSASGNQKIATAIQKGYTSVILNNDDLNITHTSHKFNKQNNFILHLQSNNACPIRINKNIVTFTLKGKDYDMPPKQANKVLQCIQMNVAEVDLSLGVYEIKVDTMQQINLFSGYSRKLQKEEHIFKVDKIVQKMQVFYDIKIGQLQYIYSNDGTTSDNLLKAIDQVDSYLTQNIKIKQFSLKHIPNITKEDIQKLKEDVEEDQTTECTYDKQNQSITVKLLDENDFLKVEWRIKYLQSVYVNNQIKEQVKYPDTWQPQKQEIQQFVVPPGSPEFNRVESLFKIGKIKELLRIQNKIIYKKYYEEGLFLKTFNGGQPVKKMELFHGTRTTNPQQIYRDKEESFNINYSSDSNLLGRGIYFAEKAEYSDSYKYTEKGFFSSTYSMFLCQVYVGQSQKCPKHDGNIKDTTFRDQANRIRYESMTDFLVNSNIYVVYKSRRAYPLYLIKY